MRDGQRENNRLDGALNSVRGIHAMPFVLLLADCGSCVTLEMKLSSIDALMRREKSRELFAGI